MKKKLILLVSILMLTLTIGITASADELISYKFDENMNVLYPITSINLTCDENLGSDYYVHNVLKQTIGKDESYNTKSQNKKMMFDDELYIQTTDTYYWYNSNDFKSRAFLCRTLYDMNSNPTNISFNFDIPFVLKDYIIDTGEINSSLQQTLFGFDAGYTHSVDAVNVYCWVLEYKFIDDEWQIVPVMYEYSYQYDYVSMFSLLQVYNSLKNDKPNIDEFPIHHMSISFKLTTSLDVGDTVSIYSGIYVDYDIPISNIYTTLNNQVWLEPIEYDYTEWIVNATKGFLDAEILPGFKISGILGICLTISLLMYILKLFLGG